MTAQRKFGIFQALIMWERFEKYRQAMSEPRTLRSLLDSLAEHGDRQAVLAIKEEGPEHWSYRELAKHTLGLAHGLTEIGVGRGDNVALLAANRPEWMVACLAVVGAGAVVTPVDAQLADAQLGRVLGYSEARFVFTTADQSERLERLDTEVAPRLVLLDV